MMSKDGSHSVKNIVFAIFSVGERVKNLHRRGYDLALFCLLILFHLFAYLLFIYLPLK